MLWLYHDKKHQTLRFGAFFLFFIFHFFLQMLCVEKMIITGTRRHLVVFLNLTFKTNFKVTWSGKKKPSEILLSIWNSSECYSILRSIDKHQHFIYKYQTVGPKMGGSTSGGSASLTSGELYAKFIDTLLVSSFISNGHKLVS